MTEIQKYKVIPMTQDISEIYEKMLLRVIKCKECGENKPLEAKGMCKNCYQKYRRNTNMGKTIKCPGCGETKKHHARGFCIGCYNRLIANKKRYPKWKKDMLATKETKKPLKRLKVN